MNPTTNPKAIYIIIGTLAAIAIMGMLALCLGLFFHVYADASVMTAVVTLTSGASGALGAILANTRSTPAPATESTTTTSTSTTLPPTPSAPAKVEVTNTDEHPVPTTEAKP